VARDQGADLWTLRSAGDVARLWAARGERQRAVDLLAPILGWFTEGFATPDLTDTRALLFALA
jgi:predicted ATPase